MAERASSVKMWIDGLPCERTEARKRLAGYTILLQFLPRDDGWIFFRRMYRQFLFQFLYRIRSDHNKIHPRIPYITIQKPWSLRTTELKDSRQSLASCKSVSTTRMNSSRSSTVHCKSPESVRLSRMRVMNVPI